MFLESTEAWQLLSLCTALVVAFLLAVHFTKLKTKVPLFYSWIGAIAIFGGALAFLLPIALDSGFGKDDDGRVLRQLILYTTGGVLGVITLGESHRKNNQEKEKNENDHTRQVYAERRSRYTKAIEQLADEKATIRLGGIYTLVGLVDEWLADDSLQPYEQRKEGQIIINNLCSYIRSPFRLAEKRDLLESDKAPEAYLGDFDIDQSIFSTEQEIRQSIFKEISYRTSREDKLEDIPHISWNYFIFNFRKSPIFYPLDALTLANSNFSESKFYGNAKFNGTHFIKGADFSSAIFAGTADFSNTRYTGPADFSLSTFKDETIFVQASFKKQGADFSHTKFLGGVNLKNIISIGKLKFNSTLTKQLVAAFNLHLHYSLANLHHLVIFFQFILGVEARLKRSKFSPLTAGSSLFLWAANSSIPSLCPRPSQKSPPNKSHPIKGSVDPISAGPSFMTDKYPYQVAYVLC